MEELCYNRLMEQAIKTLFETKEPQVYALYEQLIEMVRHAIGVFEIHPKKSSIHLHHGADFLGIHPKKKWLDINIVLDHPLEDPRLVHTDQPSKNRYHNYLRLSDPEEIDARLVEYLRDSYALMSMRNGVNVG